VTAIFPTEKMVCTSVTDHRSKQACASFNGTGRVDKKAVKKGDDYFMAVKIHFGAPVI
jgi:hypothetical protein